MNAWRVAFMLTLFVAAGCYRGPAGHFLAERTSDDVGLVFDENTALGQVEGEFTLYASGQPLPSARYVIDSGTWGPDQTFNATARNVANSSEVVTLSGTAGGNATSVTWQIGSGPSDSATLQYIVDTNVYDPYKCWKGPGSCAIVLGEPSCTVTATAGDDTTVTYDFVGSFPYKAYDLDLIPGTTRFGDAYPNDEPIRASSGATGSTWTDGGATLTALVSGGGAGTIDVSVTSWTGSSSASTTFLQVWNDTPKISKVVLCPAAILGQSETARVAADGEPDGLTVQPPYGLGNTVALDGNTLVAGGVDDDTFAQDAGAAYVFVDSGSGFVQTQKLFSDTPATIAWMGASVALDGDVLAVGAPQDLAGGLTAGAAYVFERVAGLFQLVAHIPNPSPQQYDDNFGAAVAVGGGRVVIGARGESTLARDAGAVYVYEKPGGVWTLTATLRPSDAALQQFFGSSVAIDGDTLVVGAMGDDTAGDFSGAGYVYQWNGASWVETKLLASSSNAYAKFGSAVAIADDRVVVGARGTSDSAETESGAAYVFERIAGVWTETARLVPTELGYGWDFGFAVAFANGRVLVGAPVFGGRSRIYVYESQGGAWTLTTKLFGSDLSLGGFLGMSLATDGDVVVSTGTAIVGGNRTSSAYLFELP